MAYRISATTDNDAALLDAIRTLAWQKRLPVSEVIRSAFLDALPETLVPRMPEEVAEISASAKRTGRKTPAVKTR